MLGAVVNECPRPECLFQYIGGPLRHSFTNFGSIVGSMIFGDSFVATENSGLL